MFIKVEFRLYRGCITIHEQYLSERWRNSFIRFKSALTRVINKYANENNLLKKSKLTISGDDIKEGLTCVLSTKIPDPKFSSQTKDKLVSSEIRMIVETIINEKLSIWFDQNHQ